MLLGESRRIGHFDLDDAWRHQRQFGADRRHGLLAREGRPDAILIVGSRYDLCCHGHRPDFSAKSLSQTPQDQANAFAALQQKRLKRVALIRNHATRLSLLF